METEGSSSEDNGLTKTRSNLSEESLGSSSSSSVLNSWTILPVVKEKDDGVEKIEELTDLRPNSRADKQKNERCNRPAADDPQADDISDGISIISDCESTDRISPNLFLREPLLGDLGFSDLPTSPVELIAPINTGQLKEYPERQQEQEQEDPKTIVRSKFELQLPPLVQNGLTAFFYVAATLAILAFLGKLRNPEWQVLGEEKPLVELERRVGELELQNNLLRAEIDIMSKKIQYLGSGQDTMQRQGAGRSKGKTFKAWPGNGDSVKPVDITKDDLKQPFQCADGQFVEIAGMCLENKQHLDSLTDEIGDAVNDVLQQSGAFHKFEKVTEKLGTFADDDNENVNNDPQTATSHGQSSKLADGMKERYRPKYKQEYSSNERKQRRPDQDHSRRSRNDHDHSKEYGKKKYYDQSSNRGRHNKKSNENSNENSKERGDPNDSGSGEWHERMMQQRENARHKHAQKRNNNNWYIERGDSREKMRSGETKR
ncbi:uncharacterized protein LOC108103620 isoform X2 [Drosophila eugracilis]|uniref:uncharacterized protein LOC108103620 isoform X2 n=1 Tax=Drosophila eugracilis TaxID=29029 RepID=UPI0007E8A11F|nr:uncharacterized protein LOC108103620 isoform X2 [Drosophila eugracilis]